jgi:rhamnose utilization protein RhaD (predicted bifunctional aldolase and dehydrogenase)
VVLAKHGLVVWGESAREAYEQTVAVCNQAADLVNRRSERAQRFDGRAAHGSRDADGRHGILVRSSRGSAALSPASARRY